MIKKGVILVLSLLFSTVLFAQTSLIVFQVKTKTHLFWLHNKSDQPVLIDHPLGSDPGAQAGWASVINAGRWSIVSLSKATAQGKKTFSLSCSTWTDGKTPIKALDCHRVMAAGELRGTRLPVKLDGGFWFAENKSLLGLRQHFQYWKVPYPYLYFLYLKVKGL